MPAPSNDNFANAIALSTTLPGNVTDITQFDATLEGGESAFNSNQSVWYKITPTVTGTYRFTFSNFSYGGITTINDGQVSMYLGGSAATSLATFTPANSLSSDSYRTEPGWEETYASGITMVEGQLTASTTYYIRIGAYTGSGTNSGIVIMDMDWDIIPPPANDNFANAIALTANTTVTGQSTRYATHESGEHIPYGGSLDGVYGVWFTFTPGSTGRYRFDIANTDVVPFRNRRFGISVYTGSAVNALTLVKFANSQSPSSNSAVDQNYYGGMELILTSGTTYRIRVDSPDFTGDPEHTYAIDFEITCHPVGSPSAPANNNIANAVDLGTNPSDGINHSGTYVGASYEAWEATGGYDVPSVWYKFVAGATETREMHVVGESLFQKPYFEVYQVIGSDPPTAFADIDFIESGDYSSTFGGQSTGPYDCAGMIPLVSGETYYVYIADWNWNGDGYTEDFIFFFGDYVPPSAPINDDFLDAYSEGYPYAVHGGPYGNPMYWTQSNAIAIRGTTAMATAQSPEPAHGGFTATRSVWYWWDVNYQDDQDWTITVESAEDCVVGLYNIPFGADHPGELEVLLQDDDSGPGNTPQIVWNAWEQSDEGDFDPGGWNGNYIAIVVDMKAEGDFVLKLERATTGTPPANDDFADATVISALPFTASGTTVDATAEFFEPNAEMLGRGPLDTVWYKYVATADAHLKVKCSDISDNDDAYVQVDAWQGTDLETLVRAPEPPNPDLGYFNWGDTPEELEEQAYHFDVFNGETYYIRVQTESGGSEDFTIYIEEAFVYLNLTVSSSNQGPVSDFAQAYVDIQPGGTEEFHGTILDAATVPLKITPITTYEEPGVLYTDNAIVYLNLQVLGGECYSTFAAQLLGEGEAELRWTSGDPLARWVDEDELRWSEGDVSLGEGIHC